MSVFLPLGPSGPWGNAIIKCLSVLSTLFMKAVTHQSISGEWWYTNYASWGSLEVYCDSDSFFWVKMEKKKLINILDVIKDMWRRWYVT